MTSILQPQASGYRFRDRELAKAANQLRSQLQQARIDGLKVAALGGDQESSFEQAFASLAYNSIKDKAPKLLDYLVGFQLIDRNDDNTKAAGLFGFQVGKQWVYAPVFFLSGDLKGHELLYLKANNTFVPLKENWINYILGKQPHVLGDPERHTTQQLGIRAPNLDALAVQPGRAKYSSAQELLKGWEPWAADFAPTLGHLVFDAPSLLEKFAGLTERLSLDRLFDESLELCTVAYRTAQQYPQLKTAFDRFYGEDLFTRSLQSWRERLARPESLLDVLPPAPATKQADSKLDIQAALPHDVLTCNEHQRERILRDGYIITDKRAAEEVSQAYDNGLSQTLMSPDETGVYDVLTKENTFERCLVIKAPHGCDGRGNFLTIVRLSPRDWVNAARSKVFIRPNTQPAETFRDWFDKQETVESLKTNTYYVAVTPNGQATCPFEVNERVGEGLYKVYDRDSVSYDYRDDNISSYDEACCYSRGPSRIQLNLRQGSRLKSIHGTLYLPPDSKILTVRTPNEDSEWSRPCPVSDGNSSGDPPIQPGSLLDMQFGLLRKKAEAEPAFKLGSEASMTQFIEANTTPLKVHSSGTEVVINSGAPLTHKQALFSLVAQHGLRESVAKRLLKEADRKHTFRCRVKYANPYPMLGPGPGSPPIPDPQWSTDPSYGGVPSVVPQVQYQTVPDMSATQYDPQVYDPSPEMMPDPRTMQYAQQAGQMGQKEVFDTAIISGLLKNVRQDSHVTRYLSDLLRALDRLGRLLFLFYWHNQDFLDRYGKADAPELEDSLRNTFESLGDLVLFLKEKDAQPMLSKVDSAPDVDEAALL